MPVRNFQNLLHHVPDRKTHRRVPPDRVGRGGCTECCRRLAQLCGAIRWAMAAAVTTAQPPPLDAHEASPSLLTIVADSFRVLGADRPVTADPNANTGGKSGAVVRFQGSSNVSAVQNLGEALEAAAKDSDKATVSRSSAITFDAGSHLGGGLDEAAKKQARAKILAREKTGLARGVRADDADENGSGAEVGGGRSSAIMFDTGADAGAGLDEEVKKQARAKILAREKTGLVKDMPPDDADDQGNDAEAGGARSSAIKFGGANAAVGLDSHAKVESRAKILAREQTGIKRSRSAAGKPAEVFSIRALWRSFWRPGGTQPPVRM